MRAVCAQATAFMVAFSRYERPDSTTASGPRPSSSGVRTSQPAGASSSCISRALPGLLEARSSRRSRSRGLTAD